MINTNKTSTNLFIPLNVFIKYSSSSSLTVACRPAHKLFLVEFVRELVFETPPEFKVNESKSILPLSEPDWC
jgi:hypothetical protein